MIHIYDGSNQFRLRLETDPTGLVHRNFYREISMHQPDVVVFVWDGFNCNARRREIYPPYKTKRKPLAEDIFKSMNLFKEVLKLANVIQIEVPGYEADDVIASLALLIQNTDNVLIHSNDGDYLQLVNDRIKTTRETSYNGVSPDLIPLYKATVGDPSDSIIGIPGFGDKTWSDVDKDHLIQFFKRLEAGENPPAETVFGLPKRYINWMNKNHDTMRAVWKIVHFFEVPDHLMKKHSVMGTPDPAKVDTLLREFWL